MELDLSLNEELLESGYKKLRDSLSNLQRYWSECSANNARKRKEWAEFLCDMDKSLLKFRISEIRNEITLMWEKCFKSEDEKNRFVEFHSNAFSESLLEKHRIELEKLKAFYTQHKELIELLAKYDEMWKCVVSIQEQAQNPERLFKNRGAHLLKEEQDRKLISKIPQLQNLILKAIEKKEAEGTIFLIRGEAFSDIMKRHIIKKEERKAHKRTPLGTNIAAPSSKRSRTTEHIGRLPDVVNSHRKAVRQLLMK